MIKRYFIPGSEWIYFKIYSGTKTIESIILNNISPFINEISNKRYIQSFFFIRYSDPMFHLRLRIKVTESRYLGKVMVSFYRYMNKNMLEGLVSSIMIDTYNREIERYGINSIDISEDIFHIDSVAQINILRELYDSKHKEPDILRWKLSILLIDDILNAFNYTHNDKCTLLISMADGFKKEFNFTGTLYTKQLNEMFRENRSNINSVFKRDLDHSLIAILNNRKAMLEVQANKILYLKTNNLFQPDYSQYISSLIHMTMNRLFRTRNRLCEMVIYEFLNKYYTSEQAKIKYNNKII